MTLGGIVCIRNGEELDYCWKEAVESLLPVCDMVTLCVASDNSDNTEQLARDWGERDPRVVVCIYPWPNPRGDPNFWVDWLQYAKHHTPTDYVFQIDGDEILSEQSYPELERFKQRPGRFSVWCKRYNFWNDAQHLIPSGYCCGDRVVRMMPQNIFLPSDGPDPRGAESTNISVDSGIEIFHYGFLRERTAFFKKARAIHDMFFATYDARLVAAEKYDGKWSSMPGVSGWEDKLVPYTGHHPQVAYQWLKDRDYDPK